MMKEIYYGKEARDKILSGVQKITRAVGVTMGSSGRTVMIGKAVYGNDGLYHLPTNITKDGYSVSKNFELSDPVENRGAMVVREAAEKTVSQAGDATTCTCVLAGAMIESGMGLVDNGANSQEVKRGIDACVNQVVEELEKMSIKVAGNNKKIFQVATVSANNDEVIGKYIADAYAQIGDEGVIDIRESKTLDTEIKVSNGFKWEKGWISQKFVNKEAKQTCEFDNPLILLYDKKVTHHTQIEKAFGISVNQRKPLVIICEDAEGEGLAYSCINNQLKQIEVCIIKASGFGDLRHSFMEDLAILTGGEYVSDLNGIDIKKVEIRHFGKADKIVVSKDDAVIIGAQPDKAALTDLLNDLRMNLAEAKTEDEKYPIEKRIAGLTGSVAVIEVGAATDTELGEKLDRYDDAVRSTKSAISEGVIPGGGTALVRISQKLSTEDRSDTDFYKGRELVLTAIKKPLLQICENAGLDAQDILQKVSSETGTNGYNVKTGKIEDLIASGIIDATKAIRCALINAASVAGSALTSETLIVTVS